MRRPLDVEDVAKRSELNAALLAAAANRRGSRIGPREIAAGDGRRGAGRLRVISMESRKASGVPSSASSSRIAPWMVGRSRRLRFCGKFELVLIAT